MQSISKRELFIQAFDTYKLHASFLFNIGLLMFAIQIIIPSIITGLLGGGGAGYIVYQIAYTILSTGISLGIIVQMIQLVRGGEPEDVSNIFNHFHKVPSNLLGSFIIISGMICMITLFLMMTTGLEMYQEIINRAADGLEPDWEIILGENPSSIMILGIILMGISIWLIWKSKVSKISITRFRDHEPVALGTPRRADARPAHDFHTRRLVNPYFVNPLHVYNKFSKSRQHPLQGNYKPNY